jgi:hypothetical protein
MSISFKRYIDIVSGVGAGAAVRLRELIGRLFTVNPLLPTKSFIEFDDADSVGLYFGYTSAEYLRALFYFGWVSKLTTRPNKISFARWADADTAPRAYGVPVTQQLSDWTGVTDGGLILTLGADTNAIGPLDFSAAVDLAGVATIIQTAVRAETGAMWTAAAVTYDPIRGSFNFVGGVTGNAVIVVEPPATGTDITVEGFLGWGAGAILSDGVVAETPTQAISESADASTNFGSFTFIAPLTLDEVTTLGAWTHAQNNRFMFSVPVEYVDAEDYADALSGFSGVGLTLVGVANEYPELAPMMIMAASDFTRPNSAQNYMYQIFNLTPSVTTDARANELDPLRVNYYGETQTAGQKIRFYQRGTLQGGPQDAIDMNVFANEVWLKDYLGALLMELLLNLPALSADEQGRGYVLTTIQVGVDQALDNGVILIGKTLTNTQRVFITNITGEKDAWQQVQTIGYWLNVAITSEVVDDRTEYTATYILVYSKGDAIRKIEGTHTLI